MAKDVETKMGRPPTDPEEHAKPVMVSMAPDVHEWLKAQPGGVSKTIAKLARLAMKKEKRSK